MHLLDGQVHHDTHPIPMGNYVSAVGNYVSVNPSDLGNYVGADNEFPAAQQSVAETQDAPTSWLGPLGVGPADQRLPFQDSVRVLLTTMLPPR